MKISSSVLIFLAFLLTLGCKATGPDSSSSPSMWLTTANQQALFNEIEGGINSIGSLSENPQIEVDSKITYQEIDGYGFSLTGGSALHINNMNNSEKASLIRELFGQGDGDIGISYLRVSIGASDLDAAPFTYNDLPAGQTDINLDNFSLAPDRIHLIPVLKQILEVNPEIKILGSPWSAPSWMKTNNSPIGGSLKPEYYEVYANYFVKYIKGMEAEGIKIDAITIQNEPQHDGNNPSMVMSSNEQKEFIKNHLGPAFETANINTKIIIWDHNADRPDFPINILNDPEAKQYVDGSAFHFYAGNISALSEVHEAHPDKNIYFTEQWIGAPGNFSGDLAWHTRNLIVGATRNWSRNVLQWNLASDQNLEPHTEGGCDQCLGGLTIEGDSVTRNPGYYIIAHASKFVRPGSVRISSNEVSGLPNVAFKTPEDNIVVIILNDLAGSSKVELSIDGELYSISLAAGSVATLVF
ncbi:MAG: glycoside hydrolase family 30 beta sandwich domain-containing protein [Balneolaceae bacterium]